MTPDELCSEFAETGLRISVKDLEDLAKPSASNRREYLEGAMCRVER